MVEFAKQSDVAEIRAFWDLVFPEEPDFNDYFFDNIFDFEKTLILKKDDVIASMAQLLPYSIKGIGPVTYVYGVATRPEYRKQGLMKEVLKKSFEIDIQNGVKASVLIPATGDIFNYYRAVGYETASYIYKYFFDSRPMCKIVDIKKATFEDCQHLAEIYSKFIKAPAIERTGEYFREQMAMYNTLGGAVYIYGNSYAIVSDRVEEIVFDSEKNKNCLLNAICQKLNVDFISVTCEGNIIPFGMIKKHCDLDLDRFYMNMMYN